MQKISSKFTVFFEAPFWVGVYERFENNKLYVCKVTFGPEPKDYEVYEFLLQNHKKFVFSSATAVKDMVEKRINPKRMQRDISKQLSSSGVSTKSQIALKIQQEANKIIRRKQTREEKEARKQVQFEIRQKKKKEKHKGK